ncbi:MAG: HAD-IIIA family hydrolase [Pseudomonadota bacterium]
MRSLDAAGLWFSGPGLTAPGGSRRRRPALFLDRDGVLVVETGYLHRPEEAALLPGAADLLVWATARGWASVIVTNQSGVGRGYYDWDAFARTQARIEQLLAAEGARPDLLLACPYSAAGLGHYRAGQHPARKPAPGMLLRGAEILNLDLSRSWIIGDRVGDLQAGKAAGLAGGLLVASGYGNDPKQEAAALALASADYRALRVLNGEQARGLLSLLA